MSFAAGFLVLSMIGGTMADAPKTKIEKEIKIEKETGIEEIVSTQSRSEKILSDQSTNILLLSKEDVAFVKADHISELALRLAGVNVARGNGQEYLASIRSPIFTGAGACGAFLMAQDGIALRAAGFCNVNELFDAFTEQAERIEVIRGPGSALYGSNALHGIINVITPSAKGDEGHLSVEGGGHENLRLNFSKGVKGKQNSLQLMATINHDGGWRKQSGYDQQKIGLRHDYSGDDWQLSSSLALSNLDQETAGYITGLDAFKDPQAAQENPNPEAYRKARSLRYWSRFSSQIKDGLRWQFTPYLRLAEMEFLMHFLPGQPLEENSQTSVGFQNGFYVNEGSDLEVITGIDFEYNHGKLRQTQEKPTTGSAFLQATIPSGKHYDYDVDSLMVAAFLQADWKLSQKLKLQTGVRAEYMRYDYHNNMQSGRTDDQGVACGFGGCRYSRPASRVDDFTAFSPKVGLLYTFAEQHDLYLNMAHGFRAPQTTELYRLQRAQIVTDLDKVILKSLEIGFRGQQDIFTYDISFYAMKKENIIFRDADFFNVDHGSSDHIGADMMIDLALSQKLSLRANMSFARHRYTFDYWNNDINLNGLDIDSAPLNYGGFQVKWTPFEKLVTELEWVHMGAYYLDPENLHQYEGHDYLNLRAKLNISPAYHLSLRIMNLTNSRYAERADYTRFTQERYFPGKPRSLYMGVDIRF